MDNRERPYDDAPIPDGLRAFLRDLRDLCRQHGVTLDGCGCCGSPSVEQGDEVVSNVRVDAAGVCTVGQAYRKKPPQPAPEWLRKGVAAMRSLYDDEPGPR